jgi:D-beta-D-heptose 7-phosphate kinase/D-beta-D-heptose 1-phosphate adenosyltransferase
MLLPDFSNKTIIIIGDVMLDQYFWGDVDRISPEAPVPVVKVNKKTMSLGGAGNVAMNLNGLHCGHRLIGLRGVDDNGDHLTGILDKEGIDHSLSTIQTHPTTTKTRILGQGQQLIRLDEERNLGIDRQAVATLLTILDDHVEDAAGVIISDYGKGIFNSDTAQRIIRRCRALNIPVFVDPKGHDWERYQGATCITPNTAEFHLVAPFDEYDESALEKQAKKVIEQLNLQNILMTRGARGMSLFSADCAAVHISTEAQEVFDVSGAGDTVIATLTAAFCSGMGMQQAASLANTAAGVVVGKIGTKPILNTELTQALSQRAFKGAAECVGFDQAADMVKAWRKDGRRVVFTNGCFDILHVGHIKLLQAAAAQGDRLVVGLNSDQSVKRLKGDSRPVVPEKERCTLLSHIKGVDLVVQFDEETPLELIRRLVPDVLVKGGDYTPETVVGRDVVEQAGGKVVIVPLVGGVSTTKVIDSMRGWNG